MGNRFALLMLLAMGSAAMDLKQKHMIIGSGERGANNLTLYQHILFKLFSLKGK